MSDVRVCKRCKGLFRSSGDAMCPKCMAEQDDIFIIIRDYLDAHPKASVKEIVKNTEVDEKTILQMLRDGRFQLMSADGSIVCEKCGKPLASGRICEDCRRALEKTLSDAAAAMRPKERDGAQTQATRRSKGMHIDVRE